MKMLLKILAGFLLVIVILIIAVVVVVHLYADSAVKAGIQTAGSKALNVGVTLGSANLSILGGSLDLSDLVINNPAGYQNPKMLELKNGKVTVELKTLLKGTVNVKEIKLDGANITMEQKGLTNNIQDVIKAISAQSGGAASQPSGKKLHIDNLEITNAVVNVKLLPLPGKADNITLKLAPIKMTNLGGDNKLDTAALSKEIFVAITKGIAEQGAGILPTDMINSMKSGVSDILNKVGTEVLKKNTEEIQKGVTEGLKGIFKK